MADCKRLIPFIQSWEGGFVDDPLDLGGATMKGVTLNTFRLFYGQDKTIQDLKLISDNEWLEIFKTGYWNKCAGDLINNQSIANLLTDWCYNSGTIAIKKLQRIIGVDDDGIMGPKTINAINSRNDSELFELLKQSRINYIYSIVEKRPANRKFLRGWIRRINSINFTFIECNDGKRLQI